MKSVIWGAGNSGFKYIYSFGKRNIDFFIDSNPSKRGFFCGKKVFHPDEINDWKELYVYIPMRFYNAVAPFLIGKGLKENIDFSAYKNITHVSYVDARKNVLQSIDEMRKMDNIERHSIIYLGITWYLKFAHDILLGLLENKLKMTVIAADLYKNNLHRNEDESILSVPLVWDSTLISNGKLREFEINKIFQKGYLHNAVENMFVFYQGKTSKEHCACMVWCMYLYAKAVLDFLKPLYLICHGTVSTQNELLWHMCKERNIAVLSMHEGVLPGTVTFDIGGDVGESFPAIYREDFSELDVTNKDLENADHVWAYLYASKLNRKQQPQTDCLAYIESRLDYGCPVIFFAGQNDVGSRMVPYTAHSKKYQSPVFQSSIEACLYLAKLCKQNHWNLVYKPHPYYIQSELNRRLPSNVIYVENGDINDLIDISDVTITILSSTNYIALIRHKPVVMLGYNQIRGKGCTYEAFQKEHIEKAIMDALQYGFTKEQQSAFRKHIAQCLKYYLYDDLQDRPIRYGRALPKCIDDFYLLEKALGVENKNHTFEDELHEV